MLFVAIRWRQQTSWKKWMRKAGPLQRDKQDLFGEVYWQLLSAMDSGVLWHDYEERPTTAVRA